VGEALRASLRVMWAVMLRDLRTRFFNHGLGFLVSIAFPLVHVVVLVAIWTALDRPAPYGDSAAVFFGVGLAPFMAWNYMSRFIMLSLVMNRPLLAFPAVKILDIVFGRGALETLGAFCMVALLVALALALGEPAMPHDLVDAAAALGAALLMGLGFGLFGALVALIFHGWVTIYMLIVIALYLLSGIVFTPHALPVEARDALSWLPTLHLVEWTRVAFFDGYPDDLLSRPYAMGWAAGSLAAGLALERAIRGRLLGG